MVYSFNHFSPAGIQKINYCCMYLNVLLLSDIVMPCGTHLDPAAYDGKPTLYWIDTNNQVHQARPGKLSWKLWKQLLNMLCNCKQRLVLQQPLGQWQLPSSTLSKTWPFFLDCNTNILYQHAGDSYTSHTRLLFDFDTEVNATHSTLPPTAVPIFATPCQQIISASRLISPPITNPTPAVCTSLSSHIASQHHGSTSY